MRLRNLYITFKCKLREIDDTLVHQNGFDIEYFNSVKNIWYPIANKLEFKEGALFVRVKLSVSSFQDKLGGKDFAYSVNMGIIPTVRLVDTKNNKDERIIVIANGGIINASNPKNVIVNFGDLWRLNEDKIERRLKNELSGDVDYIIGAIPRPLEKENLYPAMQAAILNTVSFKEYKKESSEIALLEIGELDGYKNKIESQKTEIQTLISESVIKTTALKDKDEQIATLLSEKDTPKKGSTLEDGKMDMAKDGLKDKTSDKSKTDDVMTDKMSSDKTLSDKSMLSLKEATFDDYVDLQKKKSRPANEIYTTIVDEVKIASEKLKGSDYKLSNFSLNLKTLVETDDTGFKLQLMDAETSSLISEGAVSDIRIDISTDTDNSKTSNLYTAPKVTGLTETAARTRLRSFGLSIKPIYQVADDKTIGQAFKQNPAAGDDINKGDQVIVIFAKSTDKFN